MNNYFYRGHQVHKLGVFWQTQHGDTICKACTRSGIEKLIDELCGIDDYQERVIYHLQRAVDIIERQLGADSSKTYDELLIVTLKKTINQALINWKK